MRASTAPEVWFSFIPAERAAWGASHPSADVPRPSRGVCSLPGRKRGPCPGGRPPSWVSGPGSPERSLRRRAEDGAAGGPAAPRLRNVLSPLLGFAVSPRARCVNVAARGSGCCYLPVKAGRAGAVSTCFTGEEASLRVCAGRPRGSRVLALTSAEGCVCRAAAASCSHSGCLGSLLPARSPPGTAGESLWALATPVGGLGFSLTQPQRCVSVESAHGWESWLCPSEG